MCIVSMPAMMIRTHQKCLEAQQSNVAPGPLFEGMGALSLIRKGQLDCPVGKTIAVAIQFYSLATCPSVQPRNFLKIDSSIATKPMAVALAAQLSSPTFQSLAEYRECGVRVNPGLDPNFFDEEVSQNRREFSTFDEAFMSVAWKNFHLLFRSLGLFIK